MGFQVVADSQLALFEDLFGPGRLPLALAYGRAIASDLGPFIAHRYFRFHVHTYVRTLWDSEARAGGLASSS